MHGNVCPVCFGTGIIEAPKCPYPATVEPECNGCQHSGICGETWECSACDGDGEVTDYQLKQIFDQIKYDETH
jgi:DnaJ-class molecular chaperone